MEQIKFSQEELNQISTIQTDYQSLGIQLIQIKLELENTKTYLEELQKQEKDLTTTIIETSQKEKNFAQALQEKYGKGSIDLETGIFTPTT